MCETGEMRAVEAGIRRGSGSRLPRQAGAGGASLRPYDNNRADRICVNTASAAMAGNSGSCNSLRSVRRRRERDLSYKLIFVADMDTARRGSVRDWFGMRCIST
jgi:hypothetical protein